MQCYKLNATQDEVKKVVNKLLEYKIKHIGLDENAKCIAFWSDSTFTSVDECEYTKDCFSDNTEFFTDGEDFLNSINHTYKLGIKLDKGDEMTNVTAIVVPTEQNLSISELTDLIHKGNVNAGWWGLHSEDGTVLDLAEMIRNPKSLLEERFAMALVAEKLCLTHSEISEAMEGLRKNLMDDKLPHRSMLEVELADAVIRTIDLCGALGLDLEGAIFEKLAYNKVRPDHKVENRLKEGGKKF